MWKRRVLLGFLLMFGLLLGGPLMTVATGIVDTSRHWSAGKRERAGLAPDPATTPEAVVQVYGARTVGWRGAFAVHTWLSVKPAGAKDYTTYEVIGWRFFRGGSPLVAHRAAPDRYWYGNRPELYRELRGAEAEAAIPKIAAALQDYPYKNAYRTWPGPNSNTFTAWIARAVPELRLELPPTAVGKDYLGTTSFAAASPSGTGIQVSVLGVVGGLAAWDEGLELHVLGLTLGLDPLDLGLKLPGLGRLEP